MNALPDIEPTTFELQSSVGLPEYNSFDTIPDEAQRKHCCESYVRCYCLAYFEKYVVQVMRGPYTLENIMRLISPNIFFSIKEIPSGYRFVVSDKPFEVLDLTEVDKRIHLELLVNKDKKDESYSARIVDDRMPEKSDLWALHGNHWCDIEFALELCLRGMLRAEVAFLQSIKKLCDEN